jgi:hypothetical protein
MYGVCVLLFILKFQENSDNVMFGMQLVMHKVQPHDLFKKHARRDTSSPLKIEFQSKKMNRTRSKMFGAGPE